MSTPDKIRRLLEVTSMSAGTIISAMEDAGVASTTTLRAIRAGLDAGLWEFEAGMKLSLHNEPKEGS